jgi:hypothetical protein
MCSLNVQCETSLPKFSLFTSRTTITATYLASSPKLGKRAWDEQPLERKPS